MHLQKLKTHLWLKDAPSKEELELFIKTQKYSRFVSWIPGLRMIAICNTISMYCSDEDSDIDLFVVAGEKRMWLVRILMTAIFHLLGVRRHGNKIAKRFCLSFFATTKGLDFNSFRLEHDIYLAYWTYYLKPIIDKDDTYGLLRKLNENWTSEFFSPDEHHEDERKWQVHTWHAWWKNCKILDWIDTLLKKIFLPKTIAHRESLGNPIGIIVSNDMLKFHNNDRREDIKKTLA